MRNFFNRARRSAIPISALTAAALVIYSPTARTEENKGSKREAKVRIGFEIAPVPLNLQGKKKELVGLGSYLVNTLGNCNDCHTTSPANEYEAGGNPFFGQHPKKVNAAAYLA